MNNDIIGKISAQHDMRIEDEHICAVLQGQETILPDAVKKAIRDAAQLHAKDILGKLRELQALHGRRRAARHLFVRREDRWPCARYNNEGSVVKRDGKYRFSLQFGSETREQVQAGELLERLGNRKSAVVIAALNEYIAAHPELAEPAPVSVKIDGGIRREALEQMIRSIIDERIANGQLLAGGVETPSIQMQEDLNVDIAAMISNLELFDG